MSKIVRGWHFVGATLRDGQPVPKDGVWLKREGPAVLCESGLHFSLESFDALRYAPGGTLCYVEVRGDLQFEPDKGVGRERRILARMDFNEALRFYARMQAVKVLHLWDAPQVVLDYLMTGEEGLRSAARDAAREAARDAAWGAAWEAAWGAARAAAWGAARDAARAAAWGVARDAAWGVARDAARDAARLEFNQLVFECFEGPLSDYPQGEFAV